MKDHVVCHSIGEVILTEQFEIVRIKSQRLTVDSRALPVVILHFSSAYARIPAILPEECDFAE